MKTYIKLITLAWAVLLFTACDRDFIDSISKVDPGSDETAPTINITYPTGDINIPFNEDKSDVTFKFEVKDDIEVESFTASLNGKQLEVYKGFKDYRVVFESFMYKDLPIGEHTLSVTAKDLAGKTTTKSMSFTLTNEYKAKYPGEVFYMPFEANSYLDLISEKTATVVGSPGFAGVGAIGANAYAGATDSYLTFPTEGLLSEEFSATLWVKLNAVPDRAGILVVGPEDLNNANYPVTQNNRKSGFRFFGENASGKQRFKLNVGYGTSDRTFDGGTAADADPASSAWVFFAFSISKTKASVYRNGELAKEADLTGIDWTGCDILSIGSGAPRFTGWSHLSDLSYLDEIRFYNKALTQAEVKAVMAD